VIDRSVRPAKIRPGLMVLRTEGTCAFDLERLLEVFAEQRRQFLAILSGFGPGDWAAPTRCADWSAHDVARHLCDGDVIGIAAGPGDSTLDVSAGFDPRITPGRWLAASAGDSPGATLGRLAATTGELIGTGRYRLAQDVSFDVGLPYGPMDWTVRLLHRFWDSWLHERDVLLARGAEHPTSGDATTYAAAYGVFIAAVVAAMFGDPISQKLTLGGDGGGIFEVDSRSGVTLTVDRRAAAGPPAAEVADALAGRSAVAAVLSHLPASASAALSHMADFFNTPVR
jgi:uncharacterized protein (TIGR03083 family)